MQKLLLSDAEMFAVVESVWASSLGLPAELAEAAGGSGNAESAESSGKTSEVESVNSAEHSGNSAPGISAAAGAGMWTAWVRISGGWDGAVAMHCPPELARMAAVSMFNVQPDGATLEDGREALAELVNIVGGNLKALLPPPCQSSLPILRRDALGEDISERGTKVAEMRAQCLGWPFFIELIEAGGSAEFRTGDASSPSGSNRREFTRVAVDVAMALITPEKTISCGRVKDISLNGICCECSETLPVGQACRVVLFLGDPADSINVEAEARVVRSVDSGPEGPSVAVELSEINLDSFHHICALVLNNAADEVEAEQELRGHLGIRGLRS